LIFPKLADGGTITMPLQETFWGSYFGMYTDRFGINWIFNFAQDGDKRRCDSRRSERPPDPKAKSSKTRAKPFQGQPTQTRGA